MLKTERFITDLVNSLKNSARVNASSCPLEIDDLEWVWETIEENEGLIELILPITMRGLIDERTMEVNPKFITFTKQLISHPTFVNFQFSYKNDATIPTAILKIINDLQTTLAAKLNRTKDQMWTTLEQINQKFSQSAFNGLRELFRPIAVYEPMLSFSSDAQLKVTCDRYRKLFFDYPRAFRNGENSEIIVSDRHLSTLNYFAYLFNDPSLYPKRVRLIFNLRKTNKDADIDYAQLPKPLTTIFKEIETLTVSDQLVTQGLIGALKQALTTKTDRLVGSIKFENCQIEDSAMVACLNLASANEELHFAFNENVFTYPRIPSSENVLTLINGLTLNDDIKQELKSLINKRETLILKPWPDVDPVFLEDVIDTSPHLSSIMLLMGTYTEKLQNIFKNNVSVTSLEVSEVTLRSDGLKALASNIRELKKLKTLTLERCRFTTEEEQTEFCHALQQSTTLKNLSLTRIVNIDLKLFSAILAHLPKNLESLELFYSKLSNEHMLSLANYLKTNPPLKKLSIKGIDSFWASAELEQIKNANTYLVDIDHSHSASLTQLAQRNQYIAEAHRPKKQEIETALTQIEAALANKAMEVCYLGTSPVSPSNMVRLYQTAKELEAAYFPGIQPTMERISTVFEKLINYLIPAIANLQIPLQHSQPNHYLLVDFISAAFKEQMPRVKEFWYRCYVAHVSALINASDQLSSQPLSMEAVTLAKTALVEAKAQLKEDHSYTVLKQAYANAIERFMQAPASLAAVHQAYVLIQEANGFGLLHDKTNDIYAAYINSRLAQNDITLHREALNDARKMYKDQHADGLTCFDVALTKNLEDFLAVAKAPGATDIHEVTRQIEACEAALALFNEAEESRLNGYKKVSSLADIYTSLIELHLKKTRYFKNEDELFSACMDAAFKKIREAEQKRIKLPITVTTQYHSQVVGNQLALAKFAQKPYQERQHYFEALGAAKDGKSQVSDPEKLFVQCFMAIPDSITNLDDVESILFYLQYVSISSKQYEYCLGQIFDCLKKTVVANLSPTLSAERRQNSTKQITQADSISELSEVVNLISSKDNEPTDLDLQNPSLNNHIKFIKIISDLIEKEKVLTNAIQQNSNNENNNNQTAKEGKSIQESESEGTPQKIISSEVKAKISDADFANPDKERELTSANNPSINEDNLSSNEKMWKEIERESGYKEMGYSEEQIKDLLGAPETYLPELSKPMEPSAPPLPVELLVPTLQIAPSAPPLPMDLLAPTLQTVPSSTPPMDPSVLPSEQNTVSNSSYGGIVPRLGRSTAAPEILTTTQSAVSSAVPSASQPKKESTKDSKKEEAQASTANRNSRQSHRHKTPTLA